MRSPSTTEYVDTDRLVDLLQSTVRTVHGVTQISENLAIVRHSAIEDESEGPAFTNPMIGEYDRKCLLQSEKRADE